VGETKPPVGSDVVLIRQNTIFYPTDYVGRASRRDLSQR
jgi:hypothetical protein